MRGLNVNGFVIVETLGSGRAGLLYLARHPTTGQEAIIRLASRGDSGTSAQVFLEEASSLLPHASEVATEYASNGSPVLMATAPSTAPTGKLPQPSPGSGYTQHPTTQLLDRPRPVKASLAVAVLLLGLVALGGGLAVMMMVVRAPAAASSLPRGTVADAPAPIVAAPAIVVASPAPTVPPQPAVAAKPALAPVLPKRSPPETPTCTVDQRWLRTINLELAAARRVAANRGDEAFRRYEREEDGVMAKVLALPTGADCRAVDVELDRLLARWPGR